MRRVGADDDGADRLFRRSAAWAGDAADGDGGLHVETCLQAVEHLVDGRFADGAMASQRLLADAEDVCTRFAILNHGKSVAEGAVADMKTSLQDFFLAKVGEGRRFEVAPFLR